MRMLLVVFSWPLLVALVATVVLWYRAEYPEPPPDLLLRPDQVRSARFSADHALAQFRALPSAEQQQIVDGLRGVLAEPVPWFGRLGGADYPIVCLGEQHEPATRRFLAETFFRVYPVDVLMLEATPEGLERIDRWREAGRDYVPLLDADIGGLLAAVQRHSPGVALRPIEETRAQIEAREGGEGSRDRSLVRNFWRAWQPGARNVILYGALHCSSDPTWLYHHLREQLPPREDVRMHNIRVLGTGQHEPTRAFAFFLEGIGMGGSDFVVTDTGGVPVQVRRWFASFSQQVLGRFATLVVFYNRPGTLAAAGARREPVLPIDNAPGSGDPLPQWIPAR